MVKWFTRKLLQKTKETQKKRKVVPVEVLLIIIVDEWEMKGIERKCNGHFYRAVNSSILCKLIIRKKIVEYYELGWWSRL